MALLLYVNPLTTSGA